MPKTWHQWSPNWRARSYRVSTRRVAIDCTALRTAAGEQLLNGPPGIRIG